MSRYIDADALAYKVVINGDADFINKVTMLMIDAPSIDIVRCKDCKWHSYDTDDECRWRIEEIPKDDDFCSYGQKGDENVETD